MTFSRISKFATAAVLTAGIAGTALTAAAGAAPANKWLGPATPSCTVAVCQGAFNPANARGAQLLTEFTAGVGQDFPAAWTAGHQAGPAPKITFTSTPGVLQFAQTGGVVTFETSVLFKAGAQTGVAYVMSAPQGPETAYNFDTGQTLGDVKGVSLAKLGPMYGGLCKVAWEVPVG